MRRLLVAALVASVVWAGTASAASEQASCVGLLTSFEAAQLPTGAVADEVVTLAHAGELAAVASAEAKAHGGSVSGCIGG